jgi:predicted nucleic acid-binding protein
VIYFLDTSALVQRYLPEPGSAQVRGLFRRRRTIAVARIAWAEIAATMARQCREGMITEATRDAIFQRLAGDFAEMTVIEIRAPVMSLVMPLVVRWPIRGYDAVQLAAASSLHAAGIATTFWSGDVRLYEAARGEGMRAALIG